MPIHSPHALPFPRYAARRRGFPRLKVPRGRAHLPPVVAPRPVRRGRPARRHRATRGGGMGARRARAFRAIRASL